MVEKKEVLYSSDIEIALVTDAVDRIEEHWLKQIGISDEDYLYIKKEENHLQKLIIQNRAKRKSPKLLKKIQLSQSHKKWRKA